MKHFLLCIVFCLIINCIAFAQSDTQLVVNQTNIPLVTITSKELISFFLDEFFIPETLVTKMEIIDVSVNGFGENDIVKLYPSDQVYYLQYVSDKAQIEMNKWKFTANFQITAKNRDISILNEYNTNRPSYNIFGSILKGLNQNYNDYPIKIRFERDSTTVLFELWSFNEQKLELIPDKSSRMNDPVMEKITVTSDTTFRDCIFIYKTIIDTVFIKKESDD